MHAWIAVLSAFLLTSCVLVSTSAPDIPGPSMDVTREEAISIARSYAEVSWKPETRHVLHGRDPDGVLVHTPDTTLTRFGLANGWWEAGREARGMVYQWGGFDTPRQFVDNVAQGKVAGDICTAEKRRLGDAGTSRHACGIDCSGFVSRCWRLSRPYSTKQLPEICEKLPNWGNLKAGDILLKDGHVLLFSHWKTPGSIASIYDAGRHPVWRVNASEIPTENLIAEGYVPWRYRRMRDR